MNKQREKKILSCYLKRIDQSNKPFITSFIFKFILWLALVSIIVILLQLHKAGNIHIIILISASMFSGGVLGFIVLLQSGYKQWPYIKPHIDRNSIEERIKKLNT